MNSIHLSLVNLSFVLQSTKNSSKYLYRIAFYLIGCNPQLIAFKGILLSSKKGCLTQDRLASAADPDQERELFKAALAAVRTFREAARLPSPLC